MNMARRRFTVGPTHRDWQRMTSSEQRRTSIGLRVEMAWILSARRRTSLVYSAPVGQHHTEALSARGRDPPC